MLKINAIRLEINTASGLFSTTIKLNSGLNIIRGNNTTGKSTIFQSILYALGLEELLGAKNEKTMQSVLKDQVLDDNGVQHDVLQSAVLLEIENKQIVTIKRSVVNEKRKSILVDVIYGSYIHHPNESYEVKQMYVHDPGAATDEQIGFHAFLEQFLGWDLPSVLNNYGEETKIYLPLIAPAFIIEQKSGWSTFFATQPFYGIRGAEARAIEFLLNLDVFQNERKKQDIIAEKRVLEERWMFLYKEFQKLAEKSSAELVGLTEHPTIVNNTNEIYLRTWKNGKSLQLPEFILAQTQSYQAIEREFEAAPGVDVEKSQERLDNFVAALHRGSFKVDQLVNDTFLEKEKLKQYILQRRGVEEDLKNNKSALKMYNIGAELPTPIASANCPTCGSAIEDTLLPEGTDQQAMKIEENIAFLDAQKRMIDVVLESQRKKVVENETKIASYKTELSRIRQTIRSVKKDLVADERLPSEAKIEEKINLRRQIEFYSDVIEKVEDLKTEIQLLSAQWAQALGQEKNLPKDFFSALDRQKLLGLQQQLIRLLEKFNYKSKEKETIKISFEKYLPVIELPIGNGKTKSYDIRFDSSGSDLIRCLWAYYIALFKTSHEFNGCHPNLLVFDEPQQQSASTEDFHAFLKELSLQISGQSIVFASFQNSDEDFKNATSGISFHLIHGQVHFIRRESDLLSRPS